MELGPEDVSLLEKCPHFRGWYVQASMELGPEDVSLLERCPHRLQEAGSQCCVLVPLHPGPPLPAVVTEVPPHVARSTPETPVTTSSVVRSNAETSWNVVSVLTPTIETAHDR